MGVRSGQASVEASQCGAKGSITHLPESLSLSEKWAMRYTCQIIHQEMRKHKKNVGSTVQLQLFVRLSFYVQLCAFQNQ